MEAVHGRILQMQSGYIYLCGTGRSVQKTERCLIKRLVGITSDLNYLLSSCECIVDVRAEIILAELFFESCLADYLHGLLINM